ncbi:hypothetical protein E6H35_03180 [Candidatus Bathyarchaeota archaeon]|nr:MAG: hypothetical protein E6H35_03180 [Candidatus Bathyarchaeota archaeon]
MDRIQVLLYSLLFDALLGVALVLFAVEDLVNHQFPLLVYLSAVPTLQSSIRGVGESYLWA